MIASVRLYFDLKALIVIFATYVYVFMGISACFRISSSALGYVATGEPYDNMNKPSLGPFGQQVVELGALKRLVDTQFKDWMSLSSVWADDGSIFDYFCTWPRVHTANRHSLFPRYLTSPQDTTQ